MKVAIEGLLVLGLMMSGSTPGFSREKYETIDATALGTGTQMGQNIGVTLNIYEFSTPADRQILVQAYEKGQNQGLVNALQKMKTVGHVEITGTLGNDCSYIRMIPTPTGMAATTDPVRQPMAHTAPRTTAPATTRPPGLMLVARRRRTPMAPKGSARRTTQIPEHTVQRIKPRTPTGVMEARWPPRTARLLIRSIKRLRKDRWDRCKLRRVGGGLLRRERMAAVTQARPQMETGTRERMATRIETPEAVGRKILMEAGTMCRDLAGRVPGAKALRLLAAGVGRKEAADHRLGADAAAGGAPGRRALVVGAAAAVAAGGADAAAEVSAGNPWCSRKRGKRG
jgi:hypothetical protein